MMVVQKVGWDKRSAVPPGFFASAGGIALRLAHPTLAQLPHFR